ncbi:MAG: NAD-dependent epimerase/dehydratase family protein [Clostridia bacterium]|nr:NAD-dependent epimerase/dehydratase family protein [Clostridia bacterium]
MKILLIGGTGVLSTDIRELSIKKGYEVYILNRGKSKNKNTNDKVKFIKGDIRRVEQLKETFKDSYFDVIIDFLSFSGKGIKDTLEIFNNKCDQYIFISSATAYRKTKKGEKITENYELSNPNWEYARGKKECEEFLKINYEKTGQKYTIVRPYVTYSDTRIPFAIIPHEKQWTLAQRILNGKPIVLWDNGQATCTLTSTKDFAVGMIGLFKNEKAYNEAFHITTDYTLTWYEALQCIGKALGKEVIVANIPTEYIIKNMPDVKGVLLGDKGLDREFDNTKIKSVVPNYDAQIKFEDGIKSTIEFYKNNKFMQDIDYGWDARIDNLIYKYNKKNPNFIDNFNPKSITNEFNTNQTIKDKIIYYMYKNDFSYLCCQLLLKIKRFLRKCKESNKKENKIVFLRG